ncbi:Ig-like domain-containing protein [uncultured Methanobrevibacter sp.]|uniref:beta strand repeat-containing protein n=1 Tax=uncultured Methanobrevibacter sp. TaxID=253161 RepID=UPI0025FC3FE0|nr:Ig-like domain-containing protein [uncultured Methanobrevibacter sp.]
MNKKLVFFICLIGIILSAACVSAAEDIGQTNIEDTSNLDANGDILAISSSENEILGADEPGTFTELQQMIDSGNATINLTKDYQLDGAFNSYAIKIKNPITINGNGHSIDALGKYGIRIFEISQVTSGIILDNITFKNGNSDAHGGAINIISALSDSKFTNLNFINNTAINNGGAVRFYHTSANNLFENVTFIDNTANGGNGGALYITETSTSDTFNNVRFENNVAINKDKKVDGGAINFHGKVTGATFTNVTFYKNRAEKSAGGAINIDNGIENSIFNNTHFIDNAAKTGGAIGITYKNNYISSLTFENTEFIHNTALEDDGGAINIGPWGFTDLTGTTFKKVSFINNTAQQNGGALYVTKDTISNTFEDVVFINNTAKENDGGAVRFGASNQNYITRENTFKNVKFINNTADQNGGALYVTGESTSNIFETVDFINNVAENWDGGAINFYNAVKDTSFNDILFYKNSAPGSGGGAVNCDKGMENTTFNNTIFADNHALYTSAIAISASGETSSTTIENSVFYNNTANNYLIWIGNSVSDNVIHDSIFLNNGDFNFYPITVTGNIELTDNWFGNNATNYNENPDVNYDLDNWLFLNATASPAAITLNQTSNITFKFSSYRDGSGVKEYDGPVYVYLKLNSTLGSMDRPVASTNDEIVYTPSESGNGSVTGTFKNAYYTINIENSKIPTEITLLNDTLDVKVLVFIPDVATLDPAEAGNLSYSSSNSSVAVIFKDRIIPVGTGQANITVSFAGNDIYAAAENKTIPINVELNDARVSVDNDTLELFVEDTYAINATTVPDFLIKYYTTNYTSSDESVATVDKNGTVTAVGEGNAIITVTVGDDKIFAKNSTTVNVTVSRIPTEITVANETLEMNPLDIAAINATLKPAEAGSLTYNTTNSSVAIVLFGNIIAAGEGEATITVSFNGTAKYAPSEKTINVTVTKIPTEISVNETAIEMNPLDTAAINATLTPAGAGSLSYVSSNTSVATVILGQIVALGEGEATITVSFNGNIRYAAAENKTIDVTVTKIPTEITVENETLDMIPLDIAAINATLTPAEAGYLTYNTTNSSVAIVLFGNIFAVGEGEATITVSFNGTERYAASEKTIDVTVTKIPTEISVNETAIEMNPLDTAAINATLTPAGAGFLSYVSSNSSVATVILGQIVALGEGEATITVLFNGNIIYAAAENKTIDVTVKKIPTEITIENTTIEMAPLDIAPAGANLTNNASNLFLNYVSSNSSVAIVILGEIIALSEGEATITVSFNGTTRYAAAENKTIEVKVKKIPTEITVESDAIEMNPWDVVSAGAKLTPGLDIELNYTSSDANVATVVLGEIVAVGEGEATITVSFNGDIRYAAAESKTIDVKVTKIPTEITIENTTIEMAPLDIAPTGADLINASNLFLNYVSSNSSVATVVLGQIVAVGEGTATITVSFNGNARYIAAENKTIEVTVKKIPTEITINNETMDLKVLDAVPSGAKLTPGLDLTLSYSTSNSSVATVVLGEIVAVGEGTATITVSFNGDIRYAAAENKTITVTVSLRDVSVIVENDTLDLTVDDTYTINAITDPAFLKYLTIKYTSSDESVATVAQNGTVTAVGEGTAIITVSAGGGKVYVINSTNVTVTVNRIGYEPDVTLDDKTLTVEVPENATGDITLIIGDETITAPIENGIATFDLSDVPAGDYNASITYDGDRLYDGFDIDYPISIEPEFIITAEDVTKYYGGSERFNAILTDAEGKAIAGAKVLIIINGQEYERTTDANGIASIGINLNAGEYPVVVSYNGSSVDAKVTILTTVNGTDLVKVFRNSTQYYATFRDSEGKYLKEGSTVRFNINGVMYDRQVGQNGLARLNINLNPGQYIITAMNDVTGERTANNITVLSRITETKDITKYYRNGTQYTAKIIGDDGKAVGAGETVRFNINGVFYERQTDANGIVKLNINLQPGDYIITAEYKECMVSNNVRVLPVLTASDLTKKYGTPTPFAATLVDGQGNPYANQKVEFNINGVFYYRTTESNGQAKLNINLQPGQYIITSGYNGSYIANRVTVTA